MPKEAATQGNTCFYFREEKDDNKVILEDKDLEVIGTPSVLYDDITVIAQVRNYLGVQRNWNTTLSHVFICGEAKHRTRKHIF